MRMLAILESSTEAAVLFKTLGASFCVCVCLAFTWRLLVGPCIPAYSRTDKSARVVLAASFVSLYPAVSAPFLAIAAASSMPISNGDGFMTVAPTDLVLRAVGISCGYMLYDAIYCLTHSEVRKLLVPERFFSLLAFTSSMFCVTSFADAEPADHRPSHTLLLNLALCSTPA